MGAIRQKLQSRTGASITFALLLFLVCAVISSVVIVAGTTAAGRMSQVAAMDQRYYAVTSAAELLRDTIDGRKVQVAYDKTAKTCAAQSVTRKQPDSTDAPEWTRPEESTSDDLEPKLLTDASEKLVEAMKTGEAVADRQLALTADTGIDGARLDCTVTERVQPNGMLVFVIQNGDDTTPEPEQYTLELTFSSNVKALASDSSATTSNTRVEWKFHSLRKVRGSGT